MQITKIPMAQTRPRTLQLQIPLAGRSELQRVHARGLPYRGHGLKSGELQHVADDLPFILLDEQAHASSTFSAAKRWNSTAFGVARTASAR